MGSHEGACHDSAPTVVQFTPGDKLWTQLAYQGTPLEQSGCGFSVSGFAGITPLAGWNENAASIGYRDLCRGRVWATDFDWQDNEGYPFAYTAQLMGYFLTHRK